MTTENPNDFWEKIKKLGPRKCSFIPMETYDQNGDIITNETCVLNQWKTDFENLYRHDDNNTFDSHFQNEALSHKKLLAENMLDPLYESNHDLNQNISIREVENNNHECEKRKVIRHR